MCDNAVNRCFFVFYSIPDQYKTQELCYIVIPEDPSLIVYCPDKYKTQRMRDEAVEDCLAALRLVSDWFVTSEMIKKLFTALYADENILYFNESSGDAVFNCNGLGILNIDHKDHNTTTLDDNFGEDDPDTIILIRFLFLHINFEKRK